MTANSVTMWTLLPGSRARLERIGIISAVFILALLPILTSAQTEKFQPKLFLVADKSTIEDFDGGKCRVKGTEIFGRNIAGEKVEIKDAGVSGNLVPWTILKDNPDDGEMAGTDIVLSLEGTEVKRGQTTRCLLPMWPVDLETSDTVSLSALIPADELTAETLVLFDDSGESTSAGRRDDGTYEFQF